MARFCHPQWTTGVLTKITKPKIPRTSNSDGHVCNLIRCEQLNASHFGTLPSSIPKWAPVVQMQMSKVDMSIGVGM